ncbi:hypothetical protein BC835DRAFT_62144 [Cytidiella melzeri]|nr:hypothetical protein BC835DRAFT_62144 [Cytidiella melzeri]
MLTPTEPFSFFSLALSGEMECDLGSVITFDDNRGHGVRLKEVLHEEQTGVLRVIPGFLSASTSINVRITWPGYAEHTTSIPVRVNGRDPLSEFTLTLKQLLATCVARAVQSFYNEAVDPPT